MDASKESTHDGVFICMAICLERFDLYCAVQSSDFSTCCLFILHALCLILKERPKSIKGDQTHYENFVAVSRSQPYGVSSAVSSQNGEWLQENRWDRDWLGNGSVNETFFHRGNCFIILLL